MEPSGEYVPCNCEVTGWCKGHQDPRDPYQVGMQKIKEECLLPEDPSFEELHDRIYAERELTHDPYYPGCVIECIEELCGSECLTNEDVKQIWNTLTPELRAKVAKGLNEQKPWY